MLSASMSDPLQEGPFQQRPLSNTATTHMSALKFAKLHSPKMKSVYWRHFGFPTNENDRIITKQNVVCTLCHKVLTNHGNTTNLRAHLQHRHKEVFASICAENGIKVPPRKPTLKAQLNPMGINIKKERKIKLEYSEAAEEISNAGIASEQDMLYESMVPMTYEDDEVIDNDHFAKVDISGASGQNKNSVSCSAAVVADVKPKNVGPNFRIDVIEEMDPYQMQEAVVNFIVQDMRNVETVYEPAMSQFIRTLSGNVTIPSEKKIDAIIKELHSDKLTTLSDQIKMHSQLQPFSLGFEIWTNIEHKHFLSIYFNHTTAAPEYNLLNQLYSTYEYNKFTSIDAIFEEFNLQNCTAAIVSYDYDDYLKHFLRNKNIPIILSYDVTVDKCLRNVFGLSAVASIIEEVKEVVMRYSSEINSKEVEIPTLNDEFPWTYYELLKFFSETVSWPDDVDILVHSAKIIVDTISSLAVTLDTLKGEEIPHSSMLSPITSKIINRKLSLSDTDDQLVATIKNTVAAELKRLVISDDHLTISALLDPRFHRLTHVDSFKSCLQVLTEKYNKICELEGYSTTTIRDTHVKPISTKKSNLELFFDIQENSSSPTAQVESNVDSDLKRYRNEVYVSLDESPFCWWNKMGHLYGSLRKLASLYQCVPCVVNMNFKKPIKQQIDEHQKRFMLSGSLIDAILFLHHNNKSTI